MCNVIFIADTGAAAPLKTEAFMTPQNWQAAAARLQGMLFSLDHRGARAAQYCMARARGGAEDLDREAELISFLCDHNLSADWMFRGK
jgi:hypothetical protein